LAGIRPPLSEDEKAAILRTQDEQRRRLSDEELAEFVDYLRRGYGVAFNGGTPECAGRAAPPRPRKFSGIGLPPIQTARSS